MIRLGVVRLLFKVLSTNDNSKQQIYLGSGYDSLKMIPGESFMPNRDSAESMVHRLGR